MNLTTLYFHRLSPFVVGPALEAFGFERIIFGSAPTQGSSTTSSPSDWYELARESFAELGVEQDAIDAVFGGNAKRVLTA
jgi:predicted TIM-barrel fold metal-dependent hydrolase